MNNNVVEKCVQIVVRICLFEGDNGSIDQVPDVYVSVSRHEYLYQTVFEKVIPLWRHVLPSSASRTPWLECGMLPLKWCASFFFPF